MPEFSMFLKSVSINGCNMQVFPPRSIKVKIGSSTDLFLLIPPPSSSPPPPPPHTHTHTIMDARNNKRRNLLTHARVSFSQSETSSLLRSGRLGGGGVNRKDPEQPDTAKICCSQTEILLPPYMKSAFSFFLEFSFENYLFFSKQKYALRPKIIES